MALLVWPFLLCLLIVATSSAAEELSFAFDSFSLRNLTLLGDCFIKDSNLGLTQDSQVPVSSVGRALYEQPIQLYDLASNRSASFQTSFAFSITNQNPSLAGDGLAFILVPDNTSLGSPGAWLGLENSTNLAADSRPAFFAVEFDTFLDVQFFDINDNHVGVDLGSLLSVAAGDVGLLQMDLTSGDIISAWIDYNGTAETLEVRLSYTGQRPAAPFLSSSFRIPDYVHQYMYVGFSASTHGSQELHTLYTWSFSVTAIDGVEASQSAGTPSPAPLSVPAPLPSMAEVHLARTPSPSPSSYKIVTRPSHCGSPFCIRLPAFLGLCIGSAIPLAFLILAVMLCSRKAWNSLQKQKRKPPDSETLVLAPRKFTYRELDIATKGFSTSRVIGRGACGNVYKGILSGSTDSAIAVKRSMTSSNDSRSEFLAELTIIGRLRHRNLVQLLGWCYEKDEILLVYDYMEQGSLDKLLFNKSGLVLPWVHRYKIVTGVAAALVYLHEECEQQVLHRDVKASNIMLDAVFNARLGDFGLAKVTDHNKSPDATLAAGTMGYLAPEYIHTGKASEKTDVFSYGAVVLEATCGRRPLERDLPLKENVLVDWVWSLHRCRQLLSAADKRLNGDFDEEEMVRLLKVGLWCSHPDPISRPSMRQVLQVLTGEASLPHVPLFKPTPSFAQLSLPVSLQDIISETGHSERSSCPSESF